MPQIPWTIFNIEQLQANASGEGPGPCHQILTVANRGKSVSVKDGKGGNGGIGTPSPTYMTVDIIFIL